MASAAWGRPRRSLNSLVFRPPRTRLLGLRHSKPVVLIFRRQLLRLCTCHPARLVPRLWCRALLLPTEARPLLHFLSLEPWRNRSTIPRRMSSNPQEKDYSRSLQSSDSASVHTMDLDEESTAGSEDEPYRGESLVLQ